VAFADLSLTVMPDWSIVGRAVYKTMPDSGHLLTIELPRGSSLLWAAVDANPALVHRSAPATWSIVLDGRPPDRIGLIWKTEPPSSPSKHPGGWSIALPKAGTGPSLTLLTVSTPPQVAIQGISGGLEPATMARLEIARADWLGREISDLFPKLDRSSGRDHERLVSLLIDHQLAFRSAERSLRWSESGRIRTLGDRAVQDLALISSARDSVAEAIRSAGLTDDLASAQNYLGQPSAHRSRPPVGIPEPTTIGRIRVFGRPTAFLGITTGIDEPSSRNAVTFASRPGGTALDGLPARPGLMAALLLGAAIAASFLGGYRGIRSAALALVLGVAGYAGGPAMLAGGLGLAALAWRKGRTSC
jgi:hypothetical protein